MSDIFRKLEDANHQIENLNLDNLESEELIELIKIQQKMIADSCSNSYTLPSTASLNSLRDMVKYYQEEVLGNDWDRGSMWGPE